MCALFELQCLIAVVWLSADIMSSHTVACAGMMLFTGKTNPYFHIWTCYLLDVAKCGLDWLAICQCIQHLALMLSLLHRISVWISIFFGYAELRVTKAKLWWCMLRKVVRRLVVLCVPWFVSVFLLKLRI